LERRQPLVRIAETTMTGMPTSETNVARRGCGGAGPLREFQRERVEPVAGRARGHRKLAAHRRDHEFGDGDTHAESAFGLARALARARRETANESWIRIRSRTRA
jgi:hypothetical protein